MNSTPIRRDQIAAYVTKDGSEIRELMHPDHQPVRNQSLAEAVVPPGFRTQRHLHRHTEEIYYILEGTGRIALDEDTFPLAPGDTILIQPGTPHSLENTGPIPLKLLCSCAPAYRHDDTQLLDNDPAE